MAQKTFADKAYVDAEVAKKADKTHGTHLTLGTGSGNAYRGDYGNTAYTHSQAAHAPSNAQKNSDITKAEIEAKLTGTITTHKHTLLESNDTRSKNELPSTYTDRGIVPEFKSSTTIGLPNVGKGFTGLITYQQWSDVSAWSGGKATQFGTIDDGRMYYRKGDGSGWGSWYQFYTTQNKPTPADIGAAVSNHGNHVPTTQAAQNTTFLRNDNTWYKLTLSDLGAAAASHGTHVTYGTTAPLVAGTASAGSANTVSRSDHVHPAQTSISGNAATATKATQDSAGQQINTTYIKGLSVSGRTITYTKGDGTTGTITTQDNNTTYTADTGIKLNGTKFQHTNAVTAGTAQGDANKTLSWGGTFTIPTVTYDAQGHITGKGTTTMTMPANPNTDTHHQAKNIVGASTTATANATSTNGSTYLNLIENGAVRSTHKISGTGATTVTSDSSGNITINSTNTTYSAATQSANGLMTAADKKKLDGIATGANAYTHPSYTAKSSGFYKVTVDATGHVSATTAVAKADIEGLLTGAITTHTHSYIPLAGNTGAYSITGNLEFSDAGTSGGFKGVVGKCGTNDYWRVGGLGIGSNDGRMEIATSDDGNEPIYVRQYTGVYATLVRTATLLDANGNTTFPGSVTTGGKVTLQYNSTSESLDFIFI